ncbi:MAG: 3-phosphoserine/phosphohydroxythreonine transaminase [Bacteroidetes bacterium]|jgi:phosphoserine aminotransferase|nr:3-phosphoserine/phosphohydroxythreonine transaminase [Bacteroidota bacterium]MBT3749065.1 3-phosphoserine/phosphohydroxythreonine transaminase [Bacteroidota bacterium]MBT4400953.1 3-phosphoserine/phosphohydroxythreonine transaminase [Bacteroidota bacterium]MBT4408953.1 3-phosphoserine/phosphohydroxythreonine transaminase [Bacteroidota bacterium]MBT7095704.1 3-phosphoserine/phosphohydroxythreonine transaminase [Bacteroidota bacterium]
MRKHIFNAGPCILSDSARENTAKAILDLDGIGQSIMEVSHRGKEFVAIFNETVELFKEVLNIPEGYSVLFLGGGASMQFCMIPYNFLNNKGAYLNTGTWATKAIKEAKLFGEVDVVGTSEDDNFLYVPKDYVVPADADYFHITTNNTIKGTEILKDMDCEVPLIADMSSDILSRPVDVAKYAMIYGGAQKNLGPAGVTFVIIKDEMLESVTRGNIPTMLKYRTHIEKESMFNTPPVLPIFVVRETLKWVKAQGGVDEMNRRAQEKADLLYNAMDDSKMFVGTVPVEDRSRMNICFVMKEEYKEMEAEFISFAASKDCVGIKGHRSVGGFRASCYNAISLESVQVLVEAMKEFEQKNV